MTTDKKGGNIVKASIMALCLAMAASTAMADQLQDIKDKGELVCGTLGMTRGMSFIDTDNRQLVGYEADLCNAIAGEIGVVPRVVSVGVPARIPELDVGRIDILLANLAYTDERAKRVDYSYPYHVTRTTIMVSDPEITRFADLAGRKVAVVKGSTLEASLRKQIPAAEAVSFDSESQAFMAFRQGKTVGYASDEMVLLQDRTLLGEAGNSMVILDESLAVESEGVGIRKGEVALKETVNAVLAGLESSGEAEAMFMKWLGPGTSVGFEQRSFIIDSNWQPY